MYDASVNGAPEKPISGMFGFSARRVCRIASLTKSKRAPVFEFDASRSTSAACPHRVVNHGSFAGGKLKFDSHRFEDEQDVGEDDGRVNAESFGGSDGDFGC